MTAKGLTDFHCHLLPNIDDGPESIEESIAIARILRDYGFTDIYCTPHFITGIYENNYRIVNDSICEVQDRLVKEDIDVALHGGMEYSLDECLLDQLNNPYCFPGNYLLIEVAPHILPDFILNAVYSINRKGLNPLMAHPERNPLLYDDNFLKKLVEIGCYFQGNLGSLAGIYGRTVQKQAIFFLRKGIYLRIASDTHRVDRLENILSKGFDTLRSESNDLPWNIYFSDR